MESVKIDLFKEPKRREIINGKFYLMAGTSIEHGDIVNNLNFIFKGYLKGKKCRVYGEGIKVKFDKDSPEVLPDIKIVCDTNKIKRNHIEGAPDLIIEVLSESTENKDRGVKYELYEKHGVKEYWLVDADNKKIYVYLLNKDGRYSLDYTYKHYSEEEIAEIEADEDDENEEKKRINIKTIKTSIYGDDLIIDIADIFENVD